MLVWRMLRERFFDYRGRRVFVRQDLAAGATSAVVFLHGLGSASSIYAPAFSDPAFSGRALAFDFLGCGKSDKPDDFSYDLREQGACLAALLDDAGIERADIVAHSLGGVVAVLFALAYPDRVRTLVLAEANLVASNAKISRRIVEYGDEQRFAAAFESFIGYYNRRHSPAAYRFYLTLVQTTPIALFRGAASMLARVDDDFYRAYLALPLPKVYIRGGESYHSMDERTARDFAAAGVRLETIPGAGHSMMEDRPETFFAVVADAVGGR